MRWYRKRDPTGDEGWSILGQGGSVPRTWSLAVALLAACAAQIAGHAQQAPTSVPSQPEAENRSESEASRESRTVRIEVIATDRRGRPVSNLGPSDFVVVENGTSQKIESAVLRSRVPAASASQPAASVDGVDADSAEERAAREPGTRVIAFYLDEFHVSAGQASARVRESVRRFIDEQLRPGDFAIVMKPLDHVTNIRFTRDRDALRKIVDDFEGRRGDYSARTPFEEQYIGKVPAAVRTARAQIVVSGLRALTSRIGELDSGLSALVLFTEGITVDGVRRAERRLPDLQSLARAASRSRVMLYAVDPGSPGDSSAEPYADADDSAQALLMSIARDTGGMALSKGSDVLPVLRRLSQDLDSYYVLTYQSSNPRDGRYHTFSLTSRRRDVQLRTRAGYWAPPEFRAVARTGPPSLALMRPLKRSPLIQSWLGTTVQPDGSRRVTFTWVPSATPSAVSRALGRPEVVALKVSTPAGKMLFEGDVLPANTGSAGTSRADSAVFVTPPGRLQFDLDIRRADGSKLDVGMEDVDLPEYKPGPPVILQPQIFRAASAREFRALLENANAAPMPGRNFRRTERLLMRIPTFDPAGADVQVSARLMNKTGVVLLDLPVAGGNTAEADAVRQFELPLARYAPGEYSLEVSAESASGIARQLIQFRITG